MIYNFVVFSLSRWNIEYGCNIKDMSQELAKHHRVLYIDVPLKRKERWLKKSSDAVAEVEQRIKKKTPLIKVSENLWHYIDDEILESVNGINNNYLFDLINKQNNKRFAKTIKKAVKQVSFDKYILINDNDIYNGLYMRKMLKPLLYVYYLRDRLPAMAYWKKQTTRLEPRLIEQTDLVVANSQYLADYAKQYNIKSYYVGQGCDIDHFLNAPEKIISSKDIPEDKPVVGYIGALNSERLDISLLVKTVTQMNDVVFVLVGQEDTNFKNSPLHQLSNVVFLGKKDFSELPQILNRFDVAINPQAINEITVGNYPRKVDEYLAAGKPVVATRTVAMKPFENYTYLGENADEYESLIRKALKEDNQDLKRERKIFAAEHTWKNNIKEIIDRIDQTIA